MLTGDIQEVAITASLLKMTIRGVLLEQRVEVVQWYAPTGAAFLTATAAGVAEAYWNDIKTDWRACHLAETVDLTTSVLCAEPGTIGAYGEYAIPADEQEGTRMISEGFELLPPYVGVGVRETVATRATRPGQKRFWGVAEADNVEGRLQPALQALVETLMNHFDSGLALGVPVATGVLMPQVVRIDRTTGLPTANQDVIGRVVNPYLTSQVSRKIGRGI